MDLICLGLIVGIAGGVYIYCSLQEHFLSTLLSLEFMVLIVFFGLTVVFYNLSFYFSLFYLVVAACEGVLGLSILVVMGRSHGGDYFKGVNFLV